MSTAAPTAPPKVNLRRPDVMEAVQAQVVAHYRSELVDRIRARGHVLSADGLTVKLAKEFGFCYGVERAIDLAYAARKVFPDQPPLVLNFEDPDDMLRKKELLDQSASAAGTVDRPQAIDPQAVRQSPAGPAAR